QLFVRMLVGPLDLLVEILVCVPLGTELIGARGIADVTAPPCVVVGGCWNGRSGGWHYRSGLARCEQLISAALFVNDGWCIIKFAVDHHTLIGADPCGRALLVD